MNRFVTACAIASTLFFAQSCASPVKSGDSATENHQMSDRTGHDMGQMASGNSVPIKSGEASTQTKQMPHGTGQMSPGHSGAGSHGSHSHGTETSETTRAKLTVPAKISPSVI